VEKRSEINSAGNSEKSEENEDKTKSPLVN
jgi:hypothetical protein